MRNDPLIAVDGVHPVSFDRSFFIKRMDMKNHKQNQGGFLMLEVALALLITLLVAYWAFDANYRAEQATQAMAQADSIKNVANAAETLVLEHYTDFQAGLPITRSGVTLPFGSSPGQALEPNIDQLRSMDLGLTSPASNFGSFKSLVAASYKISIKRIPAGCEASPLGATCNITGLVCFDKPVTNYGATDPNDIDTFAIGKMIGKIGGNGGASIVGSKTQITGSGAAWSEPNPIANQPAGIICAKFGFGAAGFGQFLRVKDTRDPDFQGGQTLSGKVPDSPYTLIVNGDTNIEGSLTINSGGPVGAACQPEGGMVWGEVATVPMLLKCVNGKWIPTGITLAKANDPCSPEGRMAQNLNGVSLICREGKYRPMTDMVGRGGIYQVAVYSQGQTVPLPVCSGATNPRLVVMGVVSACAIGGGDCPNNTGAFVGKLVNRKVSIIGSDGVSIAGNEAMMTVAGMCTTY